jgi:hypothetical protein
LSAWRGERRSRISGGTSFTGPDQGRAFIGTDGGYWQCARSDSFRLEFDPNQFDAIDPISFCIPVGMRRLEKCEVCVMDMGWVLLAAGAVLVWFGYVTRRQAKRGLANLAAREQESHELDFGTLGPIAAMMVAGKLTPEQADREVKLSAIERPSIEPIWNSMTSEQRVELGCNMIGAYAHPDFASKQDRFVEELKAANPELWERAKRLMLAKEKVRRAEQKLGPLDPMERDLIQLSVVDPEGYQEIMKTMQMKAAGASA